MISVFVDGQAVPFEGLEDVKDFFGLDEISEDDYAAIDGKHACVDPYSEDIHNSRVLMWADTEADLERNYRESCADI